MLCVFFVSRVARLGYGFHNTNSLHEGEGGDAGRVIPLPSRRQRVRLGEWSRFLGKREFIFPASERDVPVAVYCFSIIFYRIFSFDSKKSFPDFFYFLLLLSSLRRARNHRSLQFAFARENFRPRDQSCALFLYVHILYACFTSIVSCAYLH